MKSASCWWVQNVLFPLFTGKMAHLWFHLLKEKNMMYSLTLIVEKTHIFYCIWQILKEWIILFPATRTDFGILLYWGLCYSYRMMWTLFSLPSDYPLTITQSWQYQNTVSHSIKCRQSPWKTKNSQGPKVSKPGVTTSGCNSCFFFPSSVLPGIINKDYFVMFWRNRPISRCFSSKTG